MAFSLSHSIQSCIWGFRIGFGIGFESLDDLESLFLAGFHIISADSFSFISFILFMLAKVCVALLWKSMVSCLFSLNSANFFF